MAFSLRLAGDARAATGIEKAARHLETWRGKIGQSLTQSDPANRQPIMASESGMERIGAK